MLSDTLILVPTRLEAFQLFGQEVAATLRTCRTIEHQVAGRKCLFAKSTFSLLAGIETYQILASLPRPVTRVLLVGIGGSFRDDAPIGSVVVGERTRCVDIGIPSKFDEFTVMFDDDQSPVGASSSSAIASEQQPSVSDFPGDEIPLAPIAGLESERSGLMLSAATCSTSLEMAADRLRRFPDAVVEEMEAYAVGLACAKFNLPLSVIRGISNRVGERDKSQWKVKESLSAVKESLVRAVEAESVE